MDCGPSRFTIWRRIPPEEASTVSAVFEELLLDNSSTFRSQQLVQVCEKWNVRCGLQEMELLNISGKLHEAEKVLLTSFKYDWRNPDVWYDFLATRETALKNKHRVGDYVKPARAKCTTRWLMGLVTAVRSATQVEVDGMPRHVADCRPADEMSDTGDGAIKEEETTDEETAVEEDIEPLPVRYSGRDRHPPTYLKDYFM